MKVSNKQIEELLKEIEVIRYLLIGLKPPKYLDRVKAIKKFINNLERK